MHLFSSPSWNIRGAAKMKQWYITWPTMTHQVMLLQKWLSDKWSTDEKAFRADWGHFLFLASSANITDALLVVGDLSNSCKEENPFTGQGSHQQAADRSWTKTYIGFVCQILGQAYKHCKHIVKRQIHTKRTPSFGSHQQAGDRRWRRKKTKREIDWRTLHLRNLNSKSSQLDPREILHW